MRNRFFLVFGLVLAAVTLSGVFISARAVAFEDVADDAWYSAAVKYVQEYELMNGNSETDFAPEESLTRAMLVVVLYRLEGEPAVFGDTGFRDITGGQWYSDAVLWAVQQAIINGYGDNLFGPNDNITQEQLNLIMGRYAGDGVTQGIPGFTGGAVPASRAQIAAALMNIGGWPAVQNETELTNEVTEMNIQIGDYTFAAVLEDNAAVRELVDMLRQQPLTINMTDYSGFEKVGALGRSLTASNSQITTAEGDIVLYNGNSIVMFYGSNSWSYTRIGRVRDLTDWRAALGSGGITAVFSLPEK